jgi:hypothetical protein
MIVKTSEAGRPGYNLLKDEMVERCEIWPYYLRREDLKRALETKATYIRYYFSGNLAMIWLGEIKQGRTQRHKKFISIGCERFVGENRTKLIRWAKAKSISS